jgi:death-on-curing protein
VKVKKYVWLDLAVVLAIHDEQIAEHGGRSGLRDAGLLDAALNRPRQHLSYGNDQDIAHLAAVLAHGFVNNHPFVDGNKRVSAVVTELFLELNGHEFTASNIEIVTVWNALAAGEMDERLLADWLEPRIRAAKPVRRRQKTSQSK